MQKILFEKDLKKQAKMIEELPEAEKEKLISEKNGIKSLKSTVSDLSLQ